MKTVTRYIAFLLVAVASLVAGVFHGEHIATRGFVQTSDTVYVEKKVFVKSPAPSETRRIDIVPRYAFFTDSTIVLQSTEDTVAYEPSDSVMRVEVPIEERIYEGDGYTACVSGYDPKLEWLQFTEREVRINTVEKQRPNRWNISLSVGYGVGKGGLTPYVGITGGYTLLSF